MNELAHFWVIWSGRCSKHQWFVLASGSHTTSARFLLMGSLSGLYHRSYLTFPHLRRNRSRDSSFVKECILIEIYSHPSLACISMDLRNVSCLMSTSGHHWERDGSRQKPEPLDKLNPLFIFS